MNHKLILVDGHSTVGKSTTSNSVYKQIAGQEKAFWLHEECENHPIRNGEFMQGDIHTLEGMELNRYQMLNKWKQFEEDVVQGGKVCVLEGCFLHSIDRYLLNSAWDEGEILDYFNQVMEIISSLNPFIIFLYRPEIQKSFSKAFIDRGDWWRKLILSVPQPYGYFKTNKYSGDDSIFESIAYEQDLMGKVYDNLSCDKMKIDTTEEDWERYVHDITIAAGYTFTREQNTSPLNLEYCGTYLIEGGTNTWRIGFNKEKNCMYSSLFWPYLPMRYAGNSRYELISFPVTLHFDAYGDTIRFVVFGNYDWDFNGKTFVKQTAYEQT